MYQFDQDTRLAAAGAGSYLGRVSPAWNIGENPNGGYLMTLAVRALTEELQETGLLDPISVTTHFLRPGIPDCACQIQVQVLQVGRTLARARASLQQEGKTRLELLAALGRLEDSTGLAETLSIPRPDLPAPEDCMPRPGKLQGIELPIAERLRVLLNPARLPGARPASKVAEMSGYIRFLDGRPVDPPALLMFTDTFPPSPFSLLGAVGWVPTVEITIHLRARPCPGWVSGLFRTDDLSCGRMIENGCLWDASGQLVAQSRQIGLILPRD